MTRRIELSAAADRDLARVIGFLEALSASAAVRAAKTIRTAILRLSEFPMLGAAIEGDRRRLTIPFGKSGYSVEYRVDSEVVVIARIFHMREDR